MRNEPNIKMFCHLVKPKSESVHCIHMTDKKYYPQAKITCQCGNVFTTAATVKEMHVELCSACHPFSTGKQTLASIKPNKEG